MKRSRMIVWGPLLCCCLAVASPLRADVSGKQVQRAIRAGVRYLKQRQLPDGRWPERYHAGGETCLATLALLQAGEPADSPAIVAALRHVRRIENQHVYVVALKIMVLAAADPVAYRRDIALGAKWLVEAQNNSGLWTYTAGRADFDHSNSQFALLGLHAAAQAGVAVPRTTWQRAQTTVRRSQNKDGGWSYKATGGSYGSMTAAGVSDLVILGNNVDVRREKGFRDGAAPRCGEYRENRPLANGLRWLEQHFQSDGNPGRRTSYVYYWLYGVERCGILSGQRYFGQQDWYRSGAAYLVREQSGDGSWTNDLANTCFALLFLSKGHKPLLIQKLRWADDDRWNPDRHDLEHLLAFIGTNLSEEGAENDPTGLAWQTVGLDAPLEDWLAAPILYLQGHEFPNFNDDHRAKLREFVENGGTILAEACCGRDAFRHGFRRFAAETFSEAALRELGPGHAVYHARYEVEPAGLEGIDVGCRTSVIFSPNDLSCLWEQATRARSSQAAFELGTNIAAYASGLSGLRDRLDVVTLPESGEAVAGPPQRDALRLAQVVYDGDWRPDPNALVRFAEFLRDSLRMRVITQFAHVPLDDPELHSHPLLYMTGHYSFKLSAQEREALAAHLRRGGFLFAEACCGREAFDAALRAELAAALPGAALKPLPPDHAIYRGQPGFDLSHVRYKEAVRENQPELSEPRLLGIELDGRLVVVYSPYAIGCGLDGHACYNCRGLEPEDARRLAANVILHALTH